MKDLLCRDTGPGLGHAPATDGGKTFTTCLKEPRAGLMFLVYRKWEKKNKPGSEKYIRIDNIVTGSPV